MRPTVERQVTILRSMLVISERREIVVFGGQLGVVDLMLIGGHPASGGEVCSACDAAYQRFKCCAQGVVHFFAPVIDRVLLTVKSM